LKINADKEKRVLLRLTQPVVRTSDSKHSSDRMHVVNKVVLKAHKQVYDYE